MSSKLLQRPSLLFVLSCLSVALASCDEGDPSPLDVDTRNSLGGGGVAYSWNPMTSPTGETLWGVWGSPDEVIAVGNFGTAAHLGDEWFSKATGTDNDLCDVWTGADSRAFAVGLRGTILRYDGSWASMTSGTPSHLADVFGFEDGTAIAVGQTGTILWFDGVAWSAMTSVTDVNLFGVWGSAATDLYAVGVGGTIVHYDGAAWGFMTTATPENLSAVFGTSSNDVWAVGDNGAIMHYDGAAWGLFASGTSATLGDVWGPSPSDVWAVGSAGTIRHYDGSAWGTVESGTEANLLGVWGRSTCEIYAVGAGGTILRYAPTEVDGVQTFLCHDHPQGLLAPPTYGLRIDNLIGEGEYTFSFDYTDGVETARVLFAYDETLAQIRIAGRAYGGLLNGGAWSPEASGWIDIDFVYTTSVAVYDNCARDSGDDLYVTAADALNAGTFTLDGWGGDASFSFIDRGDEHGCSFVFDNDWDSKGIDDIADDPAIWSAAGWLQPGTSGSRDWLFIATRYVTSTECAGTARP